jgi:hypothetical protein
MENYIKNGDEKMRETGRIQQINVNISTSIIQLKNCRQEGLQGTSIAVPNSKKTRLIRFPPPPLILYFMV